MCSYAPKDREPSSNLAPEAATWMRVAAGRHIALLSAFNRSAIASLTLPANLSSKKDQTYSCQFDSADRSPMLE